MASSWNCSISFNLIFKPAGLDVTAAEDDTIHFNQLKNAAIELTIKNFAQFARKRLKQKIHIGI